MMILVKSWALFFSPN